MYYYKINEKYAADIDNYIDDDNMLTNWSNMSTILMEFMLQS